MKKFLTASLKSIALLVAILAFNNAKAQNFVENVDSTAFFPSATAYRTHLTNLYGWEFGGMVPNTGSAISGWSFRGGAGAPNHFIRTGYLFFDGSSDTITFRHRKSASASSYVVVSLVNVNGVFTKIDSIPNSATSTGIQTRTIVVNPASGWYRVNIATWTTSSTRYVLDDIYVSVPASFNGISSTRLGNMQVSLSGTTTPVQVGDPVNFTLTARNLGPNVAQNATLNVGSLSGVDITGSGCSGCTYNASTREMSISSLAINSDAILTLSGTATASGSENLTFEMNGYALMIDHISSNNLASFPITVEAPLPIKLLSLNIAPTAQGAELNWITLSEENFSHFEVQHSADGSEFTTLETIKGAGKNTWAKQYYTTKVQANEGANFYRLKNIDHDGTFDYSPVVSYNKGQSEGKLSLITYPNPAKDVLTAQVTNQSTSSLQITILNTLGQVVTIQEMAGVAQTIQVGNLKPGQYTIIIRSETGESTTQKFIKI